ncbi:PAS domain S-box protein [Pararhodobacter oceanensis]|uniref:PAS domain S-box protein n=1 Tax=Pararhodobacter oceanensis TaxID=2172121 RepID=UPI003A9049A3
MEDASYQAGDRASAGDTASEVAIAALGQLLRAAPEDLDTAILAVLERLAVHAGADRAYLFLKTGDLWSNSHEYCAPDVDSVNSQFQNMTAEELFPAAFNPGAPMPLDIADVDAMPAGPTHDMLQEQRIKSILETPLIRDGEVHGMVGLERAHKARGFTEQDRWLLNTLSEGLTSSLARRQAEHSLAEVSQQQTRTLEQMRATLAAMPELLLEVDDNGRCTGYHCSAPELLVAPPEQILGRTIEDTLPPEIAALQREGMARARREGSARVPAYPLGEGAAQRWYRLTIARRADLDGSEGFVFRIRDVTQEHARDTENAMLVQITRRMTNLATVLDADLKVRWINPALEARSGYTLEEVRGKPVGYFPNFQGDSAPVRLLRHALDTRCSARVEMRKFDRRGTEYWVDLDLQPVHRNDGAFDGFLVIETDITQRKNHEVELEALAAEASASRQRLQDAIAAIPDGFSYFDANDKLLMFNEKYRSLVPEISDLIKVGADFNEIVDAAVARGAFSVEKGHEDAWRENRRALHDSAQGSVDIRLKDGRWLHCYERLTPEGGRVGMRIEVTKLKHAERRLQDIINGARIGTWEFDANDMATTLNTHWIAMLGREGEGPLKLNTKSWRRYIHPHDIEEARAAMRAVLTGETRQFEREFRLQHARGHWVHVLCRGRVTGRDADGKVIKISGVGLDMTERRHAEERLGAILEASSIGTWQFQHETGRMIIDDAYAAMLGYTLDELTPYTTAQAEARIHPDDLQEARKRIASSDPHTQGTIEHEFRLRHRDGHWVWVLSQARVERWLAPGIPAEESGVHIDISERKKREAALTEATEAMERALAAQKDSEQRFSDIAAVSDEWFWEIGPGRKVVNLTSGFERLTGWPVDKLLGHTLDEIGFAPGSSLVHGDWGALMRAIREGAPLADMLFRITNAADSAPIWIRVNGAPYTDAKGKYLGYRGIGSCVSELIASTERAEAANQAKSQFLANMSHELRTPLTGVLGMAELLGETQVTPKQRGMIDTIRDSGEGLLTILNDVLDLAKIEAGKMTIERSAFVPADLLQLVNALFAPRTQTAGLAFKVRHDALCRQRWLGDASRLQQILNNLIGNAVKFTQRGGVTVSARIEEAQSASVAPPNAPAEFPTTLVLSITDTGIGMTPDQVAKVFDEFEQAEGSTARRFGGTGLGLSITRHLVHLMGGDIVLKSDVGAGTKVTVRLPVASATGMQESATPDARKDDLDLSGKHVLVADDNATNRKILETMLTALGLEVTLAVDGFDAFRKYRPDHFSMLLLDISMPGLDGIGALKEIRAREEIEELTPVPAVAVTANAMQHQVEEYLAAGFAGHIAKPFRKALLAETMSRLMRQTA